jgi:hypothetical protein
MLCRWATQGEWKGDGEGDGEFIKPVATIMPWGHHDSRPRALTDKVQYFVANYDDWRYSVLVP